MESALAPQFQNSLQAQMLLLQLFHEILLNRTRDSQQYEEAVHRIDEAQDILYRKFKLFYEERIRAQEEELNSALRAMSRFLVDSQWIMDTSWNPRDSRDGKGRTTLHVAAERNAPATVTRLLLGAGADPDATDVDLNTPLHVAAEKGNLRTLEILLAADAAVDKKNKYGRTPLHSAARLGHTAVVRRLLDKGADVHTSDNSREFPLRGAAYKDHVCVVQALLEGGADANRSNRSNRTALHEAALYGRLAVVKLLLLHRADVAAVDRFGSTPLEDAKMGSQTAVVKFLSNPSLWTLVQSPSCP
ncbi:serine/threonine-protein phosphatase 6 regulatory ankyrin repeat subunit C-like [Periplaneta americana]|uniref:serine/threonine-protein phosphatase 6 regulatory ankyrin repeat subunit C-like n=1 Tax=Periplaneta americana TaxID=6978 RepID=UPI0037E8973B